MDDGKRAALLSEASLLSAAIALGTNPVAVKYAVGDIPPLPFVALRFTCAGLVVRAFLLSLGSGVRLKWKHVLPMAGLGIIGVGLNNVMFTFGVDLTSASDTALIYAMPPLCGGCSSASRSGWSSPGRAVYSASCSPCSGSASSCTGGGRPGPAG
jgi:drug/metabolite transporter (DMT)-like permease